MSEQFLRKIKLVAESSVDRKVFEGLRVRFRIEKSSESTSNKSKIEIYNLSETSRTFFESDEIKASLFVGYLGAKKDQVTKSLETFGESGLIFSGTVSKNEQGKTISRRQGSEWITTLELGDGEKQLAESKVDLAFNPGTSMQAIISQVVASFGLPIGPQESGASGVAEFGMSLSGKAKDVLDGLARRFGFEWSVQNDAVQITKNDAVTPETAVIVSPETGLVENVMKTESGLEARMLLNPELTPGRAIKVEGTAQVSDGLFKCTKVVHEGDNYGPEWSSHLEAKTL